MSAINDLKIFHSETLIIPDGAVGWITFLSEGVERKLKVVFENKRDDESEEKPERSISITPENDYGLLTLTNWTKSSAIAMKEPMSVIRNEDGTRDVVKILATNHRIGAVNQLVVLLLEEEEQ